MGFLKNTAQYELVAKLTPQGRRKLATSSSTLITTFSLGDSDSYYVSLSGLTGGQVPAVSGNGNGIDLSNGGTNYLLRSTISYNGITDKKPVDPASISVTSSFEHVGYKTTQFYYSSNTVTQNCIDLNDTQTDSLTNLFYSFALPTTDAEFNAYTGLTSNQGGYSDTAYSGIAQTKILVVGIDVEDYSELIDGKSIKLGMVTSASTYNIYGTYETKGSPLTAEDIAVVDSSTTIAKFGPNRTMLFSDEILKPNGGDATKSWSNGYSQNKPYSINGKERFNIKTNPNTASVADKPVGVAYLDKGFLVITEPTIVNSYNSTYSGATGTTISYDSVRNKVSQSITCLANRGEFGVSNNSTWSTGDTVRITEVAMFDSSNTLIAIGKLNKPYEKPTDDFIAFNITIEY
tara:strand:- start:135 stop:1346 length:1212 start_codon:yes stop_codon:yes gene_type:complete